MIKVIASDMDGTLLGDNHKVAPETVEAIREAQAAGIRFMIATGRSYNVWILAVISLWAQAQRYATQRVKF